MTMPIITGSADGAATPSSRWTAKRGEGIAAPKWMSARCGGLAAASVIPRSRGIIPPERGWTYGLGHTVMKASRQVLLGGALALAFAGCHRELPAGSLVATQTPAVMEMPADSATAMDTRYPAGSRVVLLVPPFNPDSARVLSKGFVAAGDPCVSWDGRWVYFAGKRSDDSEWQIYRVSPTGGAAEQMTRMSGGAMDPAVAAHEELVFSSPVPNAATIAQSSTKPQRASTGSGDASDARVGSRATTAAIAEAAAIYGQFPGKSPVRFTFGADDAFGSTILRDGRILFVTSKPHDEARARRHLCLFAMNNDGTEVTAYAGQDDGVDYVRRPRELGDGRVAFIGSRTSRPSMTDMAECVQSAAPFVTRGKLFSFPTAACRSVEATPDGDLLACVETRGMVGRAMNMNAAVFRVAATATEIGAALFEDPRWNTIEAAGIAVRPEPQGHTTAVMPSASSGTILCLNVNESTVTPTTSDRATRLRVVAFTTSGIRDLGSVPVEPDGSVLVRLPARVPLGFDTLDGTGRVLRHQPPFVWLQPGENRGCVGCHEPRNHAPKNLRPLATQHAPAQLDLREPSVASNTSAP